VNAGAGRMVGTGRRLRAEGGEGESGMTEAGCVGDTIVGISTTIGIGAVGIVRVSGPDALRLAEAAFRASGNRAIQAEETFSLLYGHVVEPESGQAIDEVLLAIMRRPCSYTREDVIEFQCHGGHVAVRAVLGLMVRLGARVAEPGEFTLRAFLNGRIDLAQAESVAGIIAARSSAALRASVRRLDGGLSDLVRGARGELVGLLARIEATVDFAEEEVDEVDWGSLRERLTGVEEVLARLLDTAFVGRVLEQGVRTAIVGRPNVGKSSLLNALAMRERAIVSEIPGTTRDTVEEQMEIGGMPICLVDTAGLRTGLDRVERMGVERSLRAMEQADLVLAVVDLGAQWEEEDLIPLRELETKRLIVVGNKSDLVDDGAGRLKALLNGVDEEMHLCCERRGAQSAGRKTCVVSALTGEGIDELRSVIQETVLGEEGIHLEEPVLANERQRSLISEAGESVSAALSGLSVGKGEELVCEDIRRAAGALGKITGEELLPDLLDEIFSRFCLGK
jgi:tRNA modification GTPase